MRVRCTFCNDAASEPADRGERAGVLHTPLQTVLRGAEQAPQVRHQAPLLLHHDPGAAPGLPIPAAAEAGRRGRRGGRPRP